MPLRKGLNHPPHDGLFASIWKSRQGYYSEGRNAGIPVITEYDGCTSISTRSEGTHSGSTRSSRPRMGYDTTSNNDPAQGVHTLKSGRAVATVAQHTALYYSNIMSDYILLMK